jgi:1-acyl-sn-glycerol-3-phosphate acyltransferase
MMKKSLRKVPFVGKACESAGFIFVDKSSPRKVYETIKHAEKVLQGGTSLVVFPEGRRTFTGHMNEFKKGAFLLADQLQLPVVPMTIDGSFDILPRTGKLLSWHRLKLTIHTPIYPGCYPFVIRLTFCIFGPVRVADLRPEVRGEANSRTGNFLFACILVY